jgi:hypothetical protein
MSLLSQSLAFILVVVALIHLGRWVTRQVQTIGLLLSGDENATMVGYYLLMFPGILLHELSHFVTARVLGIKVTDFRLGPRRRKNSNSIELGSVSVYSGGTIRDSLVGVAPFAAGTTVLLLVSYTVFDVGALGRIWDVEGWNGFFRTMRAMPQTPDFWLWLYIIFTVSNAMMPSRADRKPWLLASLYLGGVLLVAWALGAFRFFEMSLSTDILEALQVLTLAFLFTATVNAVGGTSLWLIATIMLGLQKARVH